LCPGSIREEAKYPDSSGGAAAIDGTHTHYLLERCIKVDLADPTTMVGLTLSDHEGEFIVDADRAARVRVAVDYIKDRMGAELIRSGIPSQLWSESHVDPAYYTGRPDMGGTVDVIIWSANIVEVIDYKDGMGTVDAKSNPQLEQYALGVLAGLKLPVNSESLPSTVRFTIIQPKLALKGIPPITSHEMTSKELMGKLGEIVSKAAATDDPDAPLVPGDSQCKFCRAKGGCAAVNSHVMDAMSLFSPINIAQQSANKEPTELSNWKIKEILEAAPLMRTMIDAVEIEALRRMNAGISIPGLKVVYGRGSRVWALPDDQIALKLTTMGVPKSAVFETKLVSIAKTEKLQWTKESKGEKICKQLSARQLKILNDEYVTKMAGKPTVVSESDSRQAVSLNAAPLFGAVEVLAVETLPDWLK